MIIFWSYYLFFGIALYPIALPLMRSAMTRFPGIKPDKNDMNTGDMFLGLYTILFLPVILVLTKIIKP